MFPFLKRLSDTFRSPAAPLPLAKPSYLDIREKHFLLNGVLMDSIDPARLPAVLGEPRQSRFEGRWEGRPFFRELWIWDELGIHLEMPVEAGQLPELYFRLADESDPQPSAHYFELNPTRLFSGTITVAEQPLFAAVSDTALGNAYFAAGENLGCWRLNFYLKNELFKQIADLECTWFDDETDISAQKIRLIRQTPQPFDSFSFRLAAQHDARHVQAA